MAVPFSKVRSTGKGSGLEAAVQYYFNIAFVTVHLKKIEFTPCQEKRDLIKVLAGYLEGLTKLAVSRGLLDSFLQERKKCPSPSSLEMPHVSESKISSSLTSVTGVERKFFPICRKEIGVVGAISWSRSHFHFVNVFGRACGTPVRTCSASTRHTDLKFKGTIQGRELVAAQPGNPSPRKSVELTKTPNNTLQHYLFMLKRAKDIRNAKLPRTNWNIY